MLHHFTIWVDYKTDKIFFDNYQDMKKANTIGAEL